MTPTLVKLIEGVKAMLAVDDLDVDVPLSQLGVDSLNVVELIILCQQVYSGVGNYDDLHVDEGTTLRDIDDQMLALSQPG